MDLSSYWSLGAELDVSPYHSWATFDFFQMSNWRAITDHLSSNALSVELHKIISFGHCRLNGLVRPLDPLLRHCSRCLQNWSLRIWHLTLHRLGWCHLIIPTQNGVMRHYRCHRREGIHRVRHQFTHWYHWSARTARSRGSWRWALTRSSWGLSIHRQRRQFRIRFSVFWISHFSWRIRQNLQSIELVLEPVHTLNVKRRITLNRFIGDIVSVHQCHDTLSITIYHTDPITLHLDRE